MQPSRRDSLLQRFRRRFIQARPSRNDELARPTSPTSVMDEVMFQPPSTGKSPTKEEMTSTYSPVHEMSPLLAKHGVASPQLYGGNAVIQDNDLDFGVESSPLFVRDPSPLSDKVVATDTIARSVEGTNVVPIAPNLATTEMVSSPQLHDRYPIQQDNDLDSGVEQSPPFVRDRFALSDKTTASDDVARSGEKANIAAPNLATTEVVSTADMKAASNPNQAFKAAENGSFQVNQRVSIVGGTYKGHVGVIEHITAKMLTVSIEGVGSKSIRKTSAQATDGVTAEMTIPNFPEEVVELELHIGDHVAIVGGKYQGKSGTVENITSKMISVTIQGVGRKTIRKSSVVLSSSCLNNENVALWSESCRKNTTLLDASQSATVDGEQGQLEKQAVLGTKENIRSNKDMSAPTTAGHAERSPNFIHENDIADDTALKLGNEVSIATGKYKGRSGTVTKFTAKMVTVEILDIGRKSIRKTSLSGYSAETKTLDTGSDELRSGAEWRLPDSESGGTRFGSRFVLKMRLGKKENVPENTFLSYILQSRIHMAEVSLSKNEIDEPIDKSINESDYRYELVSAKVQADGDAGGGLMFYQPKCVRLYYVKVAGPRLTPLSVQEELERIADFRQLSPRKVVARLELLQSPAYRFPDKSYAISFQSRADLCEIEERGNIGCGFISEELLLEVCARCGSADAKRVVAIQVRIFCPQLGIFKGMLMKKRIAPGRPRIELPTSMMKVGPSRHPHSATFDRAFLLITQTGIHPMPKSTNHYIGRMLDPKAKPPPKKSFVPKKLKESVPRLWQSLGVPKDMCDAYVEKSVRRGNLRHAFIVGVADPTASIPPGHVFVTGMKLHQPDTMFITRFPCVKPSDGRMIPTVLTCPEQMSIDDWEWLNELPFGAVIFGNPSIGCQPLPEMIAAGDLDGDLYFVCWDNDILHQIKADPMESSLENTLSNKSNQEEPCGDDWLAKAQELMVDSVVVEKLGRLIGTLFTLSKKAANESDLFMGDPDAIAYANAYTQALEFGKHGGKICLPEHLHCQIPKDLLEYVASE